MDSEEVFKCSKCFKSFSYRSSLVFHERNCSFKEPKNVIKCPESDCGELVAGYKLLKKHVEDRHNVSLLEEHHRFSDFNAFRKWKEKIEKDHLCFYTLQATARVKDGKRTYYHCHRSGYFKTKSTGVRRLKSQGSNKIDSNCTSSLIVTTDVKGIVNVNYCATHFGHGSNFGRCSFTPDECAMILVDSEEKEKHELIML